MRNMDDIMDLIEKLLKEKEIWEILKMSIKELVEELGRKFKVIISVETLKMAWNYEEKHVKMYSFAEAIEWAKTNMPNDINGVVILKELSEDGHIRLHICYLDQDEVPLLGGSHPHLDVYAKSIDNELQYNFGDKDLLVLR